MKVEARRLERRRARRDFIRRPLNGFSQTGWEISNRQF
jgi:hypothetical protein